VADERVENRIIRASVNSAITDEANISEVRTLAANRESNPEVSVLDLIWLLSQHRSALAIGTAAFTTAAIVLALLLPAQYTATTVILPPQQDGPSFTNSLLSRSIGGLGMLGSIAQSTLGLKNPNDMQVALIQSRIVEDELVDGFDLRKVYRDKKESNARKELVRNTSIDSGLKDGLIRISVTDQRPARAADMANAYVQSYRKLYAGLAVSEAAQRRLFYEQQLAKQSDKLADAEQSLVEVELRTGLIEPEGQATAVIQSVAALRSEMAAKEVQIDAIRKFAADQNPDLQLAEQELGGLRRQLSQLGADTNTQSGEFLMPKGNVPRAALEYAQKLREVRYEETIFNFLETQYELAKMDEAKEGAVIQVVDPAITPDKRSGPPRLLIISGGIIGGLLLMSLVIFLKATVSAAGKDPKSRELLDSLLPSRNKTANA
jgi:uncharacterized protein involved in exopolysaccharide biosynthesis